MEIEGQIFEKQMTNHQTYYFEINGTKFIQQNKQKNSEYAKKAKKGHKITWVMVSNHSGFKAHQSWGLIVNNVIEKDCLILERETTNETQASTSTTTTIYEKEPQVDSKNSPKVNVQESVSGVSVSEEEEEEENQQAPCTPLKESSKNHLKRDLSQSSPSLFESLTPKSSPSDATNAATYDEVDASCTSPQRPTTPSLEGWMNSPSSSSCSETSPIPILSRKTRIQIRKRRKNIASCSSSLSH